MAISNKYVANINRLLKNIKSDIIADFIQVDNRELVIITNKIAATSNFNTIEQYIENVDVVNSNEIISPNHTSRSWAFHTISKILMSLFFLI